MTTLIDIVRTWLDNNPKYKGHYVIINHHKYGNELTWIACKCKDPHVYPPSLPPTPKYDFIIDHNSIEVFRMSSPGIVESDKAKTTLLCATDPSFFQKLEHYLDNSH